MYDLEIVMAVSQNGKYARRLREFKEHGLTEIGNRKVKLSLLVGTEKINKIESHWPTELDIKIIKSNFNHAAAKINEFYATYPLANVKDFKWMMRVDDDSITKISPLLDILDRLDPSDPLYLANDMCEGDNSIELSLLEELDSNYKYDPLRHEVECCILSQACFRRLLENPFTRSILQKRAAIRGGYTDICLAACARECGIFPAHFCYINGLTDLKSFLNKTSFHIHYVAHDIHPQVLEIIKNDRSVCKFCDTMFYVLEKDEDRKIVSRSRIFLNANGTIASDPPSNIAMYWLFREQNNEILIYGGDYKLGFIFEIDTGDLSEIKSQQQGKNNTFVIQRKWIF